MATGFFTLFDDIASLMDDVASISKIATKKTVGILGDDLAVNANKASGFTASRELPVLWAITKGSLLNKVIILPIALILSAFMPWLIIYVLIFGGVYLAYEGVEKIYEYFVPHKKDNKKITSLKPKTKEQILQDEKSKIKSAIVTDFILSIEIVIIALSTVTKENILIQIVVVSFVALIATIGVYGVVAMIVRMDDIGYKLIKISQNRGILSKVGYLLVISLPKVIKALGFIGTIAMLLVAGGIFLHNIEYIHHLMHPLPILLSEFLLGLIVGAIAFGVLLVSKKLNLF